MIGETDSMTLTGVLFWVCFIFCLALTAGGVSLLFRFKALKGILAFSYLQYYTILIYVFGFYVLWTGLFLAYLPLRPEVSGFSKLAVLLGTPFLLVASILQLLVVQNLIELRKRYLLVPAVLLADLGCVWLYLQNSQFVVLESAAGIYGILGCLAAMAAAFLLFSFPTTHFPGMPRRMLAGISLLTGFLYLGIVFTDPQGMLINLSFAFLFFLFNTAFCVLFVYKIQQTIEPAREADVFAAFVKRHGITSRESEIVQEICKGKSNQQVADALFVTLQTVKDHTSRIYQKTGVKSRAQLVTLVRDFG